MFPTLSGQDRIDLHMHSDRSDGRYPPREVLARCARGGLTLVAITDHDLASSLQPGPHQVGEHRLHLIGGAEVSGVHEGVEYHLLVYFPGAVPEAFQAFCAEQVRARAERYEAGRQRLALPGIPPADEEARRGERALTRFHLAASLVRAGHARDIQDAFMAHLSSAHGKVPPIETTFLEAIDVARSCGGLTSWAHPPPAAVRKHLGTFVEGGLQGLEGVRPRLSSSDRKFYKKMARRHGLFVTGGSDAHGWHDDHGLFAVQPNQIEGFLTALREAA